MKLHYFKLNHHEEINNKKNNMENRIFMNWTNNILNNLWLLNIFVSEETNTNVQMEAKEKREDKRSGGQMRAVDAELGLLNRADGSAKYSQGK